MDLDLKDKTIVAIDDEVSQLKLLHLIFTKFGANIQTATDHKEGLELLKTQTPDLLLIDIMMPEVDGITLCRQVRQISDVPIIIISAKRRAEDVVAGLRAGADDYIIKPYNFNVLAERAKAVIRRGKNSQNDPVRTTFRDDFLIIDLNIQLVIVADELVGLDTTEYDLLSYLVRNANKPCSYSDILENIWGKNSSHSPEYINAYIRQLRKKIEPNPQNPSYIITEENGGGFRFKFSDTVAAEKNPLTVENDSSRPQPRNHDANSQFMKKHTPPLTTTNGR